MTKDQVIELLSETLKRIRDDADHAVRTEAEIPQEIQRLNLISIVEMANYALYALQQEIDKEES